MFILSSVLLYSENFLWEQLLPRRLFLRVRVNVTCVVMRSERQHDYKAGGCTYVISILIGCSEVEDRRHLQVRNVSN